MPNYRRVYTPGGTYFFTIVTYCRRPIFKDARNVDLLRNAIARVKTEKPFKILAAVILPNHIHFIWQLPSDDSNYSQRISRLKVLFTRAYKAKNPSNLEISTSRHRHRESDVWQRRFWEHLTFN